MTSKLCIDALSNYSSSQFYFNRFILKIMKISEIWKIAPMYASPQNMSLVEFYVEWKKKQKISANKDLLKWWWFFAIYCQISKNFLWQTRQYVSHRAKYTAWTLNTHSLNSLVNEKNTEKCRLDFSVEI